MPKMPSVVEPYWRSPDGRQVIYNGECQYVLNRVETPIIDLVLTDPPYGIALPCNFETRGRGNGGLLKNFSGKKNHEYADIVGDSEPFVPSWMIRKYKSLVLWGANYFSDELPPSSGWLVWDKLHPIGLDQADCELAWSNAVKGVRIFRHLWNGMMRASEHGDPFHPAQKPVELMRWVLCLKWLESKRSVLDPYMGSGPVGVACVLEGRGYTGIEVSEHYCSIAADRMSQAVADVRGRWAGTEHRANGNLLAPDVESVLDGDA